MKNFRKIGIAAVLFAAVCIGAGCGAKKDNSQEVFRQYGINCLNEGKYEDAVTAFQKALDQSVGGITEVELDTCYYKAEALYKSGDTEGAIEVYDAILNYKELPKAYFLRGSLYYATGVESKKGQGPKDFDKAVELDPENYDLYIGIYEALTSAGDPRGNAKDYLQKALKIEGDKPQNHMQRGRIYYLLGDYKKAKELLEKARKEDVKEADYYLTETYEALGDTDAAQSAFSAYLESGLADSGSLYNIGNSLMKAEEYERAIECFDKALGMEKVPNRQVILKSRIAAYEYSGDFSGARKLVAEYQKEYPEDYSLDDEKTFLETR